jgi:hypothetical protein
LLRAAYDGAVAEAAATAATLDGLTRVQCRYLCVP